MYGISIDIIIYVVYGNIYIYYCGYIIWKHNIIPRSFTFLQCTRRFMLGNVCCGNDPMQEGQNERLLKRRRVWWSISIKCNSELHEYQLLKSKHKHGPLRHIKGAVLAHLEHKLTVLTLSLPQLRSSHFYVSTLIVLFVLHLQLPVHPVWTDAFMCL